MTPSPFQTVPIHLFNAQGGVDGFVIDAQAPSLTTWLRPWIEPDLARALRIALREPDSRRVAVVEHLWVSPDHQGQGLGRAWLQRFMDHAHAEVVMLVADRQEAQREHFALLQFYEAQGFETVTATVAGPLMVWPDVQAQRLREHIVNALNPDGPMILRSPSSFR